MPAAARSADTGGMPIRVLLLDLPPMMADLIDHALGAEPDITARRASSGALRRGAAGAPDAVIVGGADDSAGAATPILSRWPNSLVIAIERSARRTAYYELQPRRTSLGEIAPFELVRLIRAKALARSAGA